MFAATRTHYLLQWVLISTLVKKTYIFINTTIILFHKRKPHVLEVLQLNVMSRFNFRTVGHSYVCSLAHVCSVR